MKKVLFLCTQNACRSQMAEALTNARLGNRVRAFSAGVAPAPVHPFAVETLQALGIDAAGAESKHVSLFEDEEFDLIVTVCDDARERCPHWIGSHRSLHFPIPDPARAQGSREQVLAAFEKTAAVLERELLPAVSKRLGID